MITVENIEPWGFEHAIRGMRNAMNSWDKSDSGYRASGKRYENVDYVVGQNDLDLMHRLYSASLNGDNHAHRKFLRQIFVSMDIIAPLYWWKEFDTYKIGVTTNSCSTMHTIHKKEFELDDFSHEHLFDVIDSGEILYDLSVSDSPAGSIAHLIFTLNQARQLYLKTKNKKYWWHMIQLLPSSYNQRRTVTMNYENAITIISQRRGHKLDEWIHFCDYLTELPYLEKIVRG